MSKKSCETIGVAGTNACDRFQPSDEVVEVRKTSGTIQYTPAARRLLRVLIVDDYRDTADSLAMLVKMWGHDARLAYDGVAALEMTSAYQPDVLLLDIAMPKMDGFHLAQQLRRQTRFKDTLLVAITGYSDEAHRLLWQGAFDHYLIKPVEPATVEKLLLLQQDRLAEPPEAPRATAPTHGLLVVDDEEWVRGVLDAGMRQHGFAVWSAVDGQEALGVYWRHREAIDVVLLDVLMPGLDGPQTLVAIRELNPQVRCCFMSGNLGNYTEERLRDLGATAVLPKPFRLDEVAQVLRELAANTPLREPQL